MANTHPTDMTDQRDTRPHLGPSHDAERDEYRALSGLAVAALLIGLFSAVALVDARAVLVPMVGVVVACVALVRIARRSPELLGRKAAMVGLVLSLLFASVSLGYSLTYRWLHVRQARQIGMEWFDLVAAGRPEVAHQLMYKPEDRQKPDADVWDFYCSNKENYEALEAYLGRQLIRTLMALGTEATIRPYAIEEVSRHHGKTSVTQLFSVTYEQDGEKKTFLVRMIARRNDDATSQQGGWRIVGFDGGVRPAWEEQEAYLVEK